MMKTCPCCGAKALVADTRNVPYAYKGQTTYIENVQGEFCSSCDESITGPEETKRVMAEMRAFTKEVNAALVNAKFIRETRLKLGLTQQAAAQLFGGGNNGFSRYESGETKPTVPLIRLFEILDRHPEMLEEIRNGSGASEVS
jgi:HTH-type transcriptional regulator / antitoxin MqsA